MHDLPRRSFVPPDLHLRLVLLVLDQPVLPTREATYIDSLKHAATCSNHGCISLLAVIKGTASRHPDWVPMALRRELP